MRLRMWTRHLSKLCTIFSRRFATNMQSFPRQLGDAHPLRVRDAKEDSNNLEISFEFDGKMRQFSRKKSDSLESTLKRIGINVLNPKKKKQKKTKQQDESVSNTVQNEEMIIELRESDGKTAVSSQIENSSAWTTGRKLLIRGSLYTVFQNPPSVKMLKLPSSIMAGFPVFPQVEIEFAKISCSCFKWYACKNNQDNSHVGTTQNVENDCSEEVWKFFEEGFTFTPPISLVGSYLKVSCTPSDGEVEAPFTYETTGKGIVSPGPGLCPFDQRQLYTQRCLEGTSNFRIVCYNILADIYASGEFARNVLYPYCPEYAIEYHYRRQLMLKELIGYNADIICLQECDTKCFEGYLTPALESKGFEGAFMKKSEETSEGEAIWYRLSRFSFVKDCSICIRDALVNDAFKDISDALEQVPALLEVVHKRKTVVQVVILKDTSSGKYICFGNTHLYYKPTGGHIRLLQTAIILRHLEHVVENAKQELKVDSIEVILCGDLNSSPQSAAIDYILNKKILPENQVWFPQELSEHGFSLPLEHDFTFTSACGFPKFTNYVYRFQETLDYIMISPMFKVDGVVPLPTEETLQLHQALPSVVSPSDHLALICDLQWNL